MQEKKGREDWHVGKTIDLAQIISVIGMVIALFVFVNEFDDRVDLLEFRADMQDKQVLQQHEYVKATFELIRKDLEYIRNRLDSEKKHAIPNR